MPIKTFNTAEIKMQIKPTPCLASALGNWSMAVTHESQYESTATRKFTPPTKAAKHAMNLVQLESWSFNRALVFL
eukprot:CAMPEP_0203900092 /NCGR_PEP_ID=MMETSP0359-20131031/42408_1 /ASSEMBLY_ACC=CAM_ASM_000338 /TAXON_ID=268821 /ORGANISM="Scrippsiella Hangoei, Strain SHTV-5" /LENGTH=74 /DNA_ID=CAMNT_0050823467 /DNA_START=159 /DNA_END=383 /DNA_ORIENTATION=+